MAAVTVTVALVTTGQANLNTPSYKATETITAGEAVYYTASTESVSLASNGAVAESSVKGVSLSGGLINEYILVAESGIINPGFTATEGHLYYLGSVSGSIVPVADVTGDSGAVVSAIYRGLNGGKVKMSIDNTGSEIA